MRLVGYVRVSRVGGREGDSFISPTLQREQIEALAKARRHRIVEWIEDLDESGGKWERPGFQRALEMVERGEVDGIAVAKLDRFARSVVDALRAIERIRIAGGDLISVADNFDTTTAIGKAMLQITLVFAELERERQREGFRAARESAIGRGIHMSATVPVGYKRGTDRRLVRDAKAARVVREVFLRRANGEAYTQLAAFLDRRLPRADGGAWPDSTVDKLLRNRVYLGEARHGDIVNPDAHESIVSRAEWEAAQPRDTGPRGGRSTTLLTGILRCGNCGHPLTRGNARDYTCRARRSNGVCDQPVTIRIARADQVVTTAFLEWASRQDVEIGSADRDDTASLVAALEAAEAELAAYRDAQLLTVIGADAYTAGLRERAHRIDAAREQLVAAQDHPVLPFTHIDAGTLWPELTVAERRLFIAAAIDHVTVLSGTLPPSDRLRIAWHDEERPLRETRT